MAIKSYTPYSVPNTSTTSTYISSFKGVDLTSGITNVDNSRSPDAPHMMPDSNGYPVKRPGYKLTYSFGGKINGAYHTQFEGEDIYIIHAGKNLYWNGTAISSGNMADDYSCGVTLKGKIWVLDGANYQYIEPKRNAKGDIYFEVAAVTSIAKVPKITTGKRPSSYNGDIPEAEQGPGTSYDPFNLLTPMLTEGFTILESEDPDFDTTGLSTNQVSVYPTDTKKFFVSKDIDSASVGPVTAKVTRWVVEKDASGNITNSFSETKDYTEGDGLTVDRSRGLVTFDESPGRSVPTGEDTVLITYPHVYDNGGDDEETSTQDGIDKVNHCRFSILYGVNGAMDRIFMSGNPDEPNIDRWSDFEDPTFIGDTMYATLGSTASPIMGYSVLNNYLVTHKKAEENDRNAWVRKGELEDDGDGVFPITNIIQGDGAATNRGYCTLSSEPVFISKRGVFAMTANDVTGERYQQKRSYYIDGKLNDTDLSSACGVMWGRFYVLSTGADLYLLDTEQKSYESKAQPSTYQYECYYWPDIKARVLWTEGDTLCFGDEDGNCFEFMPSANASGNYHDWDGTDEGKDIPAYWTTPMMALGDIGHRKTIMDVFLLSQPFCSTGGTIYFSGDTSEPMAVRDYESATIFDYSNIYYANWTYICLNRPWAVRCGRKMSGLYAFQLKVEASTEPPEGSSAKVNDLPFGIYGIQIDYHVSNRIEVR